MRAGLEGSSAGSFLPAVEIEGRRLCDGGVVANVPVLQALDLGAAALVVLDCKGRSSRSGDLSPRSSSMPTP